MNPTPLGYSFLTVFLLDILRFTMIEQGIERLPAERLGSRNRGNVIVYIVMGKGLRVQGSEELLARITSNYTSDNEWSDKDDCSQVFYDLAEDYNLTFVSEQVRGGKANARGIFFTPFYSPRI